MKKSGFNSILVLVFLLAAYSCNQTKNNDARKTKTEQNTINNTLDPIFDKTTIDGLDRFFTGTVAVTPMLGNDENNEYSIANVIFDPNARTNWHTHPKGQVLLVLAGEGFYKEKGKTAQSISKGDVVNIPPNVDHWHGAAAESKLVHIAITNYKDGENVFWGDPVTDDEYKSVAIQ